MFQDTRYHIPWFNTGVLSVYKQGKIPKKSEKGENLGGWYRSEERQEILKNLASYYVQFSDLVYIHSSSSIFSFQSYFEYQF